MTPTRYIVLEHDGQWKINLNNLYYGPFATREEAVAEAMDAAGKAGKLGYNAHVLVMTEPAVFETIWQSREE